MSSISNISDALELVDHVQEDPDLTHSAALEVLSRERLEPEARILALWAQGLAERQVNDLGTSKQTLLRAITEADQNNLTDRAASIRSSLSIVLLYIGDTEGAMREAKAASSVLQGADLARNEMNLGLIMQRLGRLDEALVLYRSALAGLRRAGDRLAEARLLANRGVLHGYRGELDQGTADLGVASAIAEDLGQHVIVAGCAHNLGFLEGRRGDVPAALAWFDRAETAYDKLGRPQGMVEVLDANRAELLMSVALLDEADEAIQSSLKGLENSENATDLTETRLLASELSLARKRFSEALSTSQTAKREFDEQDRTAWALLASYVALRAQSELDERSSTTEAALLAAALSDSGLTQESQHCLLLAGRQAITSGDQVGARHLLASAASARKRGAAATRAQAWYAEALLRDAEDNQYGASRAIAAGLRVVHEYRASLSTYEMRSHAASHGLELAMLATRHAMRSGSPWNVLKAVESWRSISANVSSVRPPSDDEMRHLLAEVRRVDAEIREAALTGGRTDHLLSEKAKLEKQVRSAQRRLRGEGTPAATLAWDRDRILDQLGDRQLVSYFVIDDELFAVSLIKGTAAVAELGRAEEFRKDAASFGFSLSRLAVGSASQRSLVGANKTIEIVEKRLRSRLLEPVIQGDENLVVIPSGALHRVPWPAIARGVVAASPSLENALRAIGNPRRLTTRSPIALIAGPDLAGAAEEVNRIAAIYSNPRVLSGGEATSRSAVKAMSGAAIAHIAAHGRIRFDNPAFSSLEMSDGPLTVYDLEDVPKTPNVVVLSACDTGISKVVAGDELLGLSSALMNLGLTSLIAPVVPISDELAIDMMVELHRLIASNCTPSEALWKTSSQSSDMTPQERALRSSFVAMGA